MTAGGDPLLRFRAEFPSLDACTYLVSHSLGAMPRAAEERLAAYAREWSEQSTRAWNDGWWRLSWSLGDRIGELLGAAPGSIVMQPNVTLAAAVFLSALKFEEPRDRIVATALDFPSILYLLRGQAERGARVVEVPSDDGVSVETERLLDAIDERTRLVAVSHVLFRSSWRQDVDAIAARARRMGAMVLVDLYQSVGAVPIDLGALGVDAAIGGCLKWLCGGPGAAFLYVRPDLAGSLRPTITGWCAHRDPFEFSTGDFEPADGAGRFLHGTPAIPALRAAEAGLEIVSRAGVRAIREKSVRLTGRILDRCQAEGWPVRTPPDPDRRGGVVSVDVPHAYEVSRTLIEDDILVDYRPGGGIRIAPHFYNRDAEVDRALDAIADALRHESWKRFAPERRVRVT
ncbi:MAG: aminotransferase class V-fold PLP-dependent enzyme [bacterium]